MILTKIWIRLWPCYGSGQNLLQQNFDQHLGSDMDPDLGAQKTFPKMVIDQNPDPFLKLIGIRIRNTGISHIWDGWKISRSKLNCTARAAKSLELRIRPKIGRIRPKIDRIRPKIARIWNKSARNWSHPAWSKTKHNHNRQKKQIRTLPDICLTLKCFSLNSWNI